MSRGTYKARKGSGSTQRARNRLLDRFLADIRECCPTVRFEDHTPDCRRQPGRCADKVAMGRSAARAAIRGLDGWGAYHCHSCGFWHIGHAGRPSEVTS